MPHKESYIPRYTYNDYVQWEGRWELIDGHPIAMSPLPVPEHQRVAAEIRFALMSALKEKSCKECKAYDPLDYKINESTIIQPDVLIVCKKISKKFLDFTPALVVEVLSPATMIKDQNVKQNLYQQEGVKYYLMVDIDKKEIIICHLMEGLYEQTNYKGDYEFELIEGCMITPLLNNIWS